MTQPARLAGVALALTVFSLTACDKSEQPKPLATTSAAAQASVAPSSTAPEAPTPVPKDASWAGSWTGSYEAQRYLVEAPKNEGAREWAQDDGGAHSGDGTITLEIADNGSIKGSARGPLGEHDVTGQVDEDVLRVRFVPKQPGPRAFSGVAVLKKEGSAVKGRLQSSSGDSLTVRDAVVELHRTGEKAAAAPTPSSGKAPSLDSSSSRPDHPAKR